MRLLWLELRDFRNYGELRFEPDEAVNVLIGPNGAGKTSLVEAIAYLGLLRSFRGTGDTALVRHGAGGAVIRGAFAAAAGEIRVEVELPEAGRRRILLNGKRPQRNREVLAEVPVVTFLPDDLDLVKRGPALRRGYVDDLAAQLWPQAIADQQDFERSLRQRNTLLKQAGGRTDPMTLAVWDERLAAAGAKVLVHRRRVLGALDPHLAESYRLVGGSGNLVWDYTSNWGAETVEESEAATDLLRSALLERQRRDMEQRVTSAGPHRDDPALVLDGRAVRTQASQGEQRTVALALRIGSYRIIAQHRSTAPILLLDDVFSELDEVRSRGVLDLLPQGQVFVTSAREDEVPAVGYRWSVEEGAIR